MVAEAVSALTRYVYDQVLAGRRQILEHLLHDDFQLAGTREHIGRAEWLQLMLDETTWRAIKVEPAGVDVSLGNAAVVTTRVQYEADRADEPPEGTWNVVDVWQQRGMDWQLLSRTVFPAV